MSLSIQLIWLFILAIPIACITWTITHEEVFKEPRLYCELRSKNSKALVVRKFFYLFTCEYCFSHYVTIIFLIFTNYKLLFDDWRGFIIGGFSLVWIANIYMSLLGLLKQDIKIEKTKNTVLENTQKQKSNY